MANWKKVIVSGSNAELLTVTASFFKGDGSALTGVVASSANALTAGSGLSAAGTYDGSVARTFTVNSGSLVAYYSGSIFGTVTGDVTITAAGVSAIGATKVTNAMLAGSIANDKLTNSTITIGSTSTALGATSTTIAGLTSVTSTTFVGALTGNASTVTTNADLTGDVTSTGNATTLATVASAGTTGGSTAIPVITINAKGLTTGITTAAVVAPASTLTGGTLASNVLASSLTSVGTLAGLTATGTTALTTLTVSGDATVTGNLSVAGTASFTNTDNLNIKDKFILINSGSAALADSGWVTQYNAAGSGSAFYLEAASAGTYGRFAVAYDVIGTSTSLTPDEFMVTSKTTANAPSADPTWGGSSNGSGNIHVNSVTGDVYIYS
jgi:hypothetical protein